MIYKFLIILASLFTIIGILATSLFIYIAYDDWHNGYGCPWGDCLPEYKPCDESCFHNSEHWGSEEVRMTENNTCICEFQERKEFEIEARLG